MWSLSSSSARALGMGATLGVALLLGIPVLSQAAPGDFAACAAIGSDQERLACYDRASGRAPAILPEAPAERTALSAPAAPGAVAAAKAGSDSLIERAWGFRPDSGAGVSLNDVLDGPLQTR